MNYVALPDPDMKSFTEITDFRFGRYVAVFTCYEAVVDFITVIVN